MITYLRSLILPLETINITLPQKGIIYEIGSGWGSLALFLGAQKPFAHVVGIDTDQHKIEQARSQNTFTNVSFEQSFAEVYPYKKCNGVVMSDFLHHVPYEIQVIIIKKIARVIKKDGVLLIKEIDKSDSWRARMSRLWDLLLYPKDSIYYRSKSQWRELLEKLGFQVKVRREVPFFPGSTYLFICTK